ncbi:hypothetical protein [Alloyangia pacifica]|uniref:Uncharacterized protein n=1 Tax=Alloyangia pacifica TaxID=311180 RepID=A0A1I6PYT7_9RHOB|nr:hypothetical protein [Alloyangia pacifica]SDG38897.1 hypothetical protein SAMN04488245_102552 [Alloyangia pacifica]SFS45387.1 hypothetical protein SAMN04488050_101853 [Alloyangia pacifica]
MQTLLRGAALLALLAATACDDAGGTVAAPPDAPEALTLFGDGYPAPGDPCRRAGESAATADYLDDAADLVACPPGTDVALFAASTGGTQVATVEGWSLFSIPVR